MKPFFFLACMAFSLLAQGQTLNGIEAVEYDPQNNRWFVSNGSSLLVTSDQGDSWDFFGEAQASHGMEVMGDVLYAVGFNVIRAYNLNNAELIGSLVISGVGFLNGLGSDGESQLVVSDFSNSRLYTIDASQPEDMQYELLAGNFGSTPNGVVIDTDNNRALVVCWGNNADILAVDLESGDVTTVVNGTGLGNLDGIDSDGNGAYYVSSWSPTRITRYTEGFTESETVVTGSGGLSSPADISYAENLDTLGVANSGNDQVTFHGFGSTTHLEELGQDPIRGHLTPGLVHLSLAQAGEVSLLVFDGVGRKLNTRTEYLPQGKVRVPLAVPSGGMVVVQSATARVVIR